VDERAGACRYCGLKDDMRRIVGDGAEGGGGGRGSVVGLASQDASLAGYGAAAGCEAAEQAGAGMACSEATTGRWGRGGGARRPRSWERSCGGFGVGNWLGMSTASQDHGRWTTGVHTAQTSAGGWWARKPAAAGRERQMDVQRARREAPGVRE
jgi:hypothetical protein